MQLNALTPDLQPPGNVSQYDRLVTTLVMSKSEANQVWDFASIAARAFGCTFVL